MMREFTKNELQSTLKKRKQETTQKDDLETSYENKPIIQTLNLDAFYGGRQVLKDINLSIEAKKITAIVGPSGCGKTTLVRIMNRMNDEIDAFRISGKVSLHGYDMYTQMDPILLKLHVGMVFQKLNPFPVSIYENVAFGPKVHKLVRSKGELDSVVKKSLEQAALWDEVKDRLNENAMTLSGGQQQRLCIARALAIRPEVLLLDEPTTSLDPISTSQIEKTMKKLVENYTIVLVTHDMQQAARVSDYTAFMDLGNLVEFGETNQIFENPRYEATARYIQGQFDE